MNNTDFDIAAEMERLLNPTEMKKQATDNSVECALEHLIKAADMLEEDKNYVMAEAVTDLMERIPAAIVRNAQVQFSKTDQELQQGLKTLQAKPQKTPADTKRIAEIQKTLAERQKRNKQQQESLQFEYEYQG